MKKAILFFLAGNFTFLTAQTQELSRSVISSGGSIASTSGMTLEWTLGEIAGETISTEKKIYTQGFHQPVLFVKSLHFPPKESSVNGPSGYNVYVAPNPTQSFVNVYIKSNLNEKFNLTLYDMSGRKVLTKFVTGSGLSVRIEMGHFSSGVYLMDVQNAAGTMIKSFKIVKAG